MKWNFLETQTYKRYGTQTNKGKQMNQVCKKYWRVYYEWSWNEYGVDVNFEDTLKQLMIGETWREIEKKIESGIGSLEIKRWKVAVDEDGDEWGDNDFDYAYVQNGELDKKTHWFEFTVPKKLHKEFNTWKHLCFGEIETP